MAVQGGLLATTIAQRTQEQLEAKAKSMGNAMPIVSFLIAKLIAYTLLGVVLGWAGSFFVLSPKTNVIMQIAVGVFMLGTALNLLEVHPVFRYFALQPPKFLTRLIRKESKQKDVFAAAFLGELTIFIPCGTTQAMMALAVASGSPVLGGLVLFAFVLGTSPVFFALGYFATRLGEALKTAFLKVAAYSIILLTVFNLNNAIALSGSNFTLDNAWNAFYCTVSFCDSQAQAATDVTNAPTLYIDDNGYSPNNLSVKAGSEVSLTVINRGGGGCVQAFTIPSLSLQKIIPVGTSEILQFTAPKEKGELAFMCSMGMYRGIINVI